MQTRIHVICQESTNSLVTSFKRDLQKTETPLFVYERPKRRNKVIVWENFKSGYSKTNGALKLRWDKETNTLLIRIVNKRNGKPDDVTGDLIQFLLSNYSKDIRTIHITP